MTQEIMDARAQVDDMAPREQVCSAIDDEMFCFSVTTEYEGNVIYSDLPGRFPIESYAGMNFFCRLHLQMQSHCHQANEEQEG